MKELIALIVGIWVGRGSIIDFPIFSIFQKAHLSLIRLSKIID